MVTTGFKVCFWRVMQDIVELFPLPCIMIGARTVLIVHLTHGFLLEAVSLIVVFFHLSQHRCLAVARGKILIVIACSKARLYSPVQCISRKPQDKEGRWLNLEFVFGRSIVPCIRVRVLCEGGTHIVENLLEHHYQSLFHVDLH